MCGLQGATSAIRVNVPSVTAMSRTVTTAIGRRRQLFSPSPERKGRRRSAAMPMTGATSRNGVSIEGGSSESSAYSHRKK